MGRVRLVIMTMRSLQKRMTKVSIMRKMKILDANTLRFSDIFANSYNFELKIFKLNYNIQGNLLLFLYE